MLFVSMKINAQSVDIFALMDRTDLKLVEIEAIAQKHFDEVGRGKGSGLKQYERWLYEKKFHIDENGYIIAPEVESKAYKSATESIGVNKKSRAPWVELGPKEWNYTSAWNPGVGRLTSIAAHPSNLNTIYVTSPGGGIWKTTNSGTTWTPLIDNIDASWMNLFHIAITPSNQSIIYAALNSGGILKSTNAGATWVITGNGPAGSRKVLIHPTNPDLVFATANNGIWRSTDAGATWTNVQAAAKEDIEFKPGDPTIMYASSNVNSQAVWKSIDAGVTWTNVGNANGITNSGRTLLGVSAANPNVVYAVQASGSSFGRLYRSTNSGTSFTTQVVGSTAAGTNYFGYDPDGTGSGGQATYDMVIAVNPNDANNLIIGGIILWESTNSGADFTAITEWSYPNSTGYTHPDMHALEWFTPTGLFSGSDGGIYKSTNGGTSFTDLSTGLGIKQFYKISCSKSNGAIVTGGAQDNGTSYRQVNGDWIDWLGADGMDNVISPTNINKVIGTSQYGNIYKTTNGGTSYTGLNRPTAGNWVTPLAMHPTNENIVWGGWNGIYKSTNFGTSWTKISGNTINSNLDCINVAASNTDYVYGSDGATLYVTTNNGATWATRTAPSSITSIEVSPTDPNKIWITCSSSNNRVFMSTNGGVNWTNLSAGLPNISARSIVVDDDAQESLYVGMNIGVYSRNNVDTNWLLLGTGLPLVAINEVELQQSTNKIRVATYGRGVWETDLNSIQCIAPTNLNSTAITYNSATINWNVVATATSGYQYVINNSPTPPGGAGNPIGTNTYAASGLNANTTYYYHVRSNCGSGNLSGWTTDSFTTLPAPCLTPTNLSVNMITAAGGTITWDNMPGASSYEYVLSTSSATPTGFGNPAPSNSYIATALLPSTTYYFHVRTLCGLTNYSGWTMISFTTSESTTDINSIEKQFIDINISPNPASTTLNINYILNTTFDYIDMQITNVKGQAVYNEKIGGNVGRNKKSIPVESMAEGVYFIKLTTDKFSEVRKFTVLK
ncbi:MAG: T9SS type A sorting domain-containing protein [Chitinophagaceae bacterium]|nr:T9SS type A sorting domain-containing protein [Chitinophagaceae bacterium]